MTREEIDEQANGEKSRFRSMLESEEWQGIFRPAVEEKMRFIERMLARNNGLGIEAIVYWQGQHRAWSEILERPMELVTFAREQRRFRVEGS